MRSQIGMKVSIVSIPAEKEDTFGNECRLGRQSVDSSISMTTFNGLGRNHVQPFPATRPPRSCLFCRHDSKTQDIRDLAPKTVKTPPVGVDEVGERRKQILLRRVTGLLDREPTTDPISSRSGSFSPTEPLSLPLSGQKRNPARFLSIAQSAPRHRHGPPPCWF
jgi:hypothetical protein